MLRLAFAWVVLLTLVVPGCGRQRDHDDDDDSGGDGDGDSDGDSDGDGDGDLDVFSLDRVHSIDLEIDEALFPQLDADHQTRVRAVMTYDGVRLEDIGIRVKCGIGSCSSMADKAGFSVKFDQFVEGQELGGYDRIILNNSIQDTSYSNELLGQELARRAGIPWKRVTYANVRLNGVAYGLFVVVEAVDKKFLKRHFGEDEVEGNVYEGPCCADFVYDPYFPELKDEDEGRTRDDLIALADFVANQTDVDFVAGIDSKIDLTGYITGYAISALAYHWDGYEYNTNNWYAFDRPSDGRFVFWLHGMDQLFYDCNWPVNAGSRGRLGQRVQENEITRNLFRDELRRMLDEVWDSDALVALLDEVSQRTDYAATTDPRHPLDAGRLATVRQCLLDRPAIVRAQLDAVCGNGVVETGEGCDDGGAEPHDGCSAACQSECGNGQLDGEEQCDDGNPWEGDGCDPGCRFEAGCGDGVVQPELFEDCDDGANGESFADGCRDDCSANECGDGRLDAGEDCDDGNLLDLDGCDTSCADEDAAATCGNGVLEAGETCDDGNVDSDDACDADCARPCDGADLSMVWAANGHCYQIFWNPVDWATAVDECAARAGHLVSITRDGEMRMLAQLGAGWIGLSDIEQEGSFGWVNGEPYEYDGFLSGEPNDWGGNEDCGELAGLGWNDLDCATARSYFCEIE